MWAQEACDTEEAAVVGSCPERSNRTDAYAGSPMATCEGAEVCEGLGPGAAIATAALPPAPHATAAWRLVSWEMAGVELGS